ncbi:hypothetical protein [Sphingomonas sp. PB1R3]|uniref:hypothetical protein n=1 Tax=Sphingomonas flavida TaxID=3096154 RepID=UPI002FC96457
MITLLALQLAVLLSNADEASFKDYRICVLQKVSTSELVERDSQIIEAAKKECEDDRLAAAMEMAADDLEREGAKKPKVDADARRNVMEKKLTADALNALVARRTKAQ